MGLKMYGLRLQLHIPESSEFNPSILNGNYWYLYKPGIVQVLSFVYIIRHCEIFLINAGILDYDS